MSSDAVEYGGRRVPEESAGSLGNDLQQWLNFMLVGMFRICQNWLCRLSSRAVECEVATQKLPIRAAQVDSLDPGEAKKWSNHRPGPPYLVSIK